MNKDKKVLALLKALDKELNLTEARVAQLVSALFDGMDAVTTEELYRGPAFINTKNKIDESLYIMAIRQNKMLTEAFTEIYVAANPFDVRFSDDQIQKTLTKQWAGRTYSESVWRNTDLLREQLQKSIIDTVANGASKDRAIQAIGERFNVSKSRASTLVRTETQHFYNQAQKDGYVQRGFDKYEYLAASDERTSTICEDLDGDIYYFKDAAEGINFPPMHPNCRSTIKPIVE